MPIGLALCFGPAMIVWWLTSNDDSDANKPQKRR